MGQILAVLSGKGGTGKTSVCAGVATALAQAGKSVLCVDCDVGLRNLDISLGMPESTLSFLDLYQEEYTLSQIPRHPDFPSLAFLTAPVRCSAEQLDSEQFRDTMRRAREKFDYVFLDAPAGVDSGFRLVTGAADRFLLVTGSGPASVRDAARVGQLLEMDGHCDVRLIVNRVDTELLGTMRLTIDDVMDGAGLPLIGVVPEDPYVTLAAAFGKPVLLYRRRCRSAGAYRRIAKRIQGYRVAIGC